MKISLIGYGKMGQEVERIAKKRGHDIISRIDPNEEQKEITEDIISSADVCIDFSHPETALNNIKTIISYGKNMVIGTTGWYDSLPLVQEWVLKSPVGFLFAPNFSLGISLFLKILQDAMKTLKHFPEYDVAGMEIHHKEKKDSPSGTAKNILSLISKAYQREESDIPLSSLRVGSIPGTHTLFFDSKEDTITLTHQARNREGFALGAVIAAEWLKGKKGFYTFENVLNFGEK